ncbi:MAG: DUF6249 domain-containing protein [Terracidiphilus sp.]
MAHLLLFDFFGDNPAMGMWIFLSVGAVALFVVFIPLVTWIDSQRKEREAFYRADTMRRLAEAPTESAQQAIALMRDQERVKRVKAREGVKIGGLINIGVGIGLIIFLKALIGPQGVYLVGLIPGLIGVAMLVYVYLMAAPLE